MLSLLLGWINQRQQQLIEYLVEENRVLREQIGNRRMRLTDDQSHLVVVERVDERPTFTRPSEEALAEWSKSFSPGRLYTMGRLTRGVQ